MIKETVNEYQFVDGFDKKDRQEFFSRAGRRALYQFLEDLSEDIGEDIEYDVIAICCDYTEFEDFNDYKKQYDDNEVKDLEDLSMHTQVIGIEGTDGFIIQNY